MMGIVVSFYPTSAGTPPPPPANFLDKEGIVWYAEVGAAGDLTVYQVIADDCEVKPLQPSVFVYAPGTWLTAVRI